MNDHIHNEHEMNGYTIYTDYDPYGQETEDEWGWFWGITVSYEPVFIMNELIDDAVSIGRRDGSRVGELGGLNWGPFATEAEALAAAKSAWLDRLGAPGAMRRLREISLDNWAANNAFDRGISIEAYERLNERGIY